MTSSDPMTPDDKHVRPWHAPRLEIPASKNHSPTDPAEAGKRPSRPVSPYEADLEAARKQGWAEGHEQGQRTGMERGRSEGRVEAVASATAAADLLQALLRERARVDARLEDEVLACIDSMARLVLRRELEHDGDALRRIVSRALEQLPSLTQLPTVYLHPDDIELLHRGGFEIDKAQVTADRALSRGDCRVKAGAAEIDAGADAWIDAVIER